MTKHPILSALALVCVCATLPAVAQTLKSVKVDPAAATAGQPVNVTAEFDISKGLNCNVRVHFGDGASQDAKVNQEKDARLAFTHSYAKPGAYTVKVEPKNALPVLKCLGKNQIAKVTVAAPKPVAAATPASGPAAGPACPEGWKLDAKSVNKKSGAFTCRAKAGTAAPQAKLACPGKLGYYENAKTGQLGCRP